MTQERLKEIKKNLGNTMIFLGRVNGKTQLANDIDWLLSTVEEQQKEINRLNILDRLHDLADENSRLREALERIKNYYPGVPNVELIPVEMLFEIHSIADKVLEQSK